MTGWQSLSPSHTNLLKFSNFQTTINHTYATAVSMIDMVMIWTRNPVLHKYKYCAVSNRETLLFDHQSSESLRQVYFVLHCSSSLTPKDMTKMGLKVTGATGEAKLKVHF